MSEVIGFPLNLRAKKKPDVQPQLTKTEISRLKREDRNRRISNIASKIRAHDPIHATAAPKLLTDAFKWAEQRNKHHKIKTIEDEFSDPLSIAESLVRYAKADLDLILSSILYLPVRPVPNMDIDESVFTQIGEKFGAKVRELVRDTLRLHALEKREMVPVPMQTPEEQHKLYLLMGLHVARDKRVILTRGTWRLKEIERAIISERDGVKMQPEEKRKLIDEGRNVIANMAYLAGYSDLRNDICDVCNILENPGQFIDDRRNLTQFGRGEEELLSRVKQHMENFFRKITPWVRVEARLKRVHAAREKANRKGQEISQLGDRVGIKVIFAADQNKGWYSDDPNAREMVMAKLDGVVHHAYAEFTKKYGRGNHNLSEEFKLLAIRDPKKKAPGDTSDELEDDRFDDYYRKPKKSGYKAIQDTGFVTIMDDNDTPHKVELEAQLVDEWQDKINVSDPKTGHMFYKTGMAKYATEVLEWCAATEEIVKGRQCSLKETYVFGPENQIFKASTVADAVRQLYGDAAQELVDGAHVESDNRLPEERRNPKSAYAQVEGLRPAERVTKVVFKDTKRPTHKKHFNVEPLSNPPDIK